MRAWSVRAIFAVLLLGMLAVRIQASHDVAHDVRPAIVELLAARGLEARAVSANENSLLKAVAIDAPRCNGPMHVYPVQLNLQEAPLFDAAVGPGRERYIAYLDRTWRDPDRLAMRLEWLKHKTLSVGELGRSTAADTTALLVASPPGCRMAESIDWSPLWHRPRSGS